MHTINWHGKITSISRINNKNRESKETSKANVLLCITHIEEDGSTTIATEYDREHDREHKDITFEIVACIASENCIEIGGIQVPFNKAINSHLCFQTLSRDTYFRNTRSGVVRRTSPTGRRMHYFNGQAVLVSWAIEVEPQWSIPVVEKELAVV